MRTLTSINWTRTTAPGTGTTHTGTRAGWTFAIRTPLTGPVQLSAVHEDGRAFKDAGYLSTASAKAGVFTVMHPAEAMGWVTDLQSWGYSATWDGDLFRAWRGPENCWYFQHRGSQPVTVTCLKEARMLAAAVLEERYGPVHPEQPVTEPEASVTALEAALRSAGISFTAKQLTVAALAMHRV